MGDGSLHQADCTDTGGHTTEDRHHCAQCHGYRWLAGAARGCSNHGSKLERENIFFRVKNTTSQICFFLEPFPLNGQKGVKPHELAISAISIEYQDELKNLFILEMICRHLLFHAFQYFYWVARMSRSRRPQLGFQPHFPA